MFCPQCGAELQAGQADCPRCVTAPPPLAPPQRPYPATGPTSPPGPYYPYPPGPAGMVPPPKDKTALTLAIVIGGVVFGFVGLFILGVIAAIAIPSFLSSRNKARQSEATANLTAIQAAQSAYFGSYNCYAENFAAIGWKPPVGTTQYAYFLKDDVIPAGVGGPYQLPEDAEAYVTKDAFQAVAVGNIDQDRALDVWVIDEMGGVRNLSDDGQLSD